MICKALYKLLHDSAGVRDRVGTRIYADYAPQGSTGECIVLRELSEGPEYHLQNEADCLSTTVQLDYYSNAPMKARSGFRLVRSLLSGRGGPGDDVAHEDEHGASVTTHLSSIVIRRAGALPEDPRDGSTEWRHRYSGDFEIFHSQTAPTHT